MVQKIVQEIFQYWKGSAHCCTRELAPWNTETFSVGDPLFLRGSLVFVISFVFRLVSAHLDRFMSYMEDYNFS